MADTENIIHIDNPSAVARHIEYITEMGLHCVLTYDEEKQTNCRLTGIAGDRLEVTLLTGEEFLPQDESVLKVSYNIDNILHSFDSGFIASSKDLLLITYPKGITRYQIRRYNRISLEDDQELQVHFDLLSEVKNIKDIRDLSEGGIGIRLKKAPPKLQKNIRINSLKLMLRENKTLHLSGILRYVRTEKENNDPFFRIGIEFDPLKEDDKHTLLDFIDEVSNPDID